MAAALREAQRALGGELEAKSAQSKRVEHRPAVGSLPGEPGSASSLRDAPRNPFAQTDSGSHRTLGCERTRQLQHTSVPHSYMR
jgi:hypothetical protein